MRIKNSQTPKNRGGGGVKSFNYLIEGDNLHSLKILEKTHRGKIDVIYIDPPYNTGNRDFIYDDNYVDKNDGYRHSKWLSFMNNRLKFAKKLLKNKGVIFISIDDNEQAQLKMLCDEVFGEQNFIATLSVENNPKGRKNSSFISGTNEYCHIYAKNKDKASFVKNIPKDVKDLKLDENGNYVHNSGKRVLVGENKFNEIVTNFYSDKHYTIYYNPISKEAIFKKEKNLANEDISLKKEGYERYYSFNDEKFVENTYTLNKIKELFYDKKLEFKNGKIYEKNMNNTIRMKSLLVNKEYMAIVNNEKVKFKIDLKTTSAKQMLANILGHEKFDYPKNLSYIKLLISLIKNKSSIILDFFAGSGTTGHAVAQLNKEDGGNRKYILCTNNENNICEEITYKRLKNIQKELPHNLKYLKTDYIPKIIKDEDDLSIRKKVEKNINELIELENHIEIDNQKYIIAESEEKIEEDINRIEKNGILFLPPGIFLSSIEQRKLDEKNIKLVNIPEYYFINELREAGEI